MQRFIITITLVFCFANFTFARNYNPISICEKYKKALINQQACQQLITKNYIPDIHKNIIEAYNACATILLAKHSFNPIKKLQHFNNRKNLLENIVQKNANNIEIRFFPLAVQNNLPKLLNYNSNNSEGKNMILQNLESIKNDADLIARITYFLKSK